MRNIVAGLMAAVTVAVVSYASFEIGGEWARQSTDNFEWRVGFAVGVAGPVGVAIGLLCGLTVWDQFKG